MCKSVYAKALLPVELLLHRECALSDFFSFCPIVLLPQLGLLARGATLALSGAQLTVLMTSVFLTFLLITRLKTNMLSL